MRGTTAKQPNFAVTRRRLKVVNLKSKKLAVFLTVILAGAVLAACDPPFPTSGSSGVTCTSATTGSGQDAWSGQYNGMTPSNGFTTYVDNEGSSIQSGSTMSTCASDPSNVGTTANITNTSACGGCVQVYPHVKQQWDDYDLGSNPPTFGKTGTEGPIPTSSLHSLTSSFNIGTTPADANAEWAYDIWPGHNSGTEGNSDLMVWVNTTASRGTGGWTFIGNTTLTINGTEEPAVLAHFGTEYIIQFGHYDTATHVMTPANYTSGTVDILEAIGIAQYVGAWSSDASLSQLNFGVEICQTAGSEQFQQFNLTEIGN